MNEVIHVAVYKEVLFMDLKIKNFERDVTVNFNFSR